MTDSAHIGDQPLERSFLEVAPDNVVALASKAAESSDDLVVRVQETEGRASQATITFPDKNFHNQVFMGAWQIRTFVVSFATGAAVLREVDLIERDL